MRATTLKGVAYAAATASAAAVITVAVSTDFGLHPDRQLPPPDVTMPSTEIPERSVAPDAAPVSPPRATSAVVAVRASPGASALQGPAPLVPPSLGASARPQPPPTVVPDTGPSASESPPASTPVPSPVPVPASKPRPCGRVVFPQSGCSAGNWSP